MLDFALTLIALATAQAPPYQCGPDCTKQGRYVLCNDSFDADHTTPGGIQLANFLESACTTFEPPAQTFTLTGFAALFGSGDILFGLIQVFKENGRPLPGMSFFESGVQIPGGQRNEFSGLLFDTSATSTVAFRMCLRQQLEDQGEFVRPILFDNTGVQAMNWLYDGMWSDASSTFSGDVILRAVVEYNDLTPWGPGGPCENMAPNDAGVGGDTGMVITGDDAGGTVNEDGGVNGADGGPDAGGTGDPGPKIIAISPNQGPNTQATAVIVTGMNFKDGLSLKIGSIAAEGVMVPGAATINASVPANIKPGVYDVIVQNPDGQADILPMGYTVTDPGTGTGNAEDSCGCNAPRSEAPVSAMLLVAVLLLRKHGDRRRRRRE